LGGRVSDKEVLSEHGVTVAFVDVGNTKIELLEAYGADSPILGFLKKNPDGGLHHVCLEVEDISRILPQLQQNHIRTLGPPKIGSHGKLVSFLHPKDCGGVLVELEEKDFPSEGDSG